jgi:SAM-dependent methyltransferase
MHSSHLVIDEILQYCRAHGISEATFGRLAVNDGKLVSRLRDGKSITLSTLERVRAFIEQGPPLRGEADRTSAAERNADGPGQGQAAAPSAAAERAESQQGGGRAFRFFDNRQKYLLFVNTCGEKQAVAERVSQELRNIHPQPPALRMFDAGVGDGTVLARVLRATHARFPTMPFYAVGKEISLEDVRLALDKMPDRFFEHPATVLVMTNMFYSEAPWLRPRSPTVAASLVWREVPLMGSSSHEFDEQIGDLHEFLAENWTASASAKTGNPVYDRPVVLVIYRQDHRFLLDPIIPHPGAVEAEYDLVIASQPYRLSAPLEFKAQKVVGPLARALRPGGRLVGVHSYGNDPGMEIIRKLWPDHNPFRHDRHALLQAVKRSIGAARRGLNFNTYSDSRSLFRYDMHTLPNEIEESIGTSTLFAAWNAAIYVAQVDDSRLKEAVMDGRYVAATQEVLQRHGGLWFNDESYVISRPAKAA